MIFLYLFSLVGLLSGFVCLTLAIASGLYYLSELVEEYSEPTKRILNRSISTIFIIYGCLWLFEGFPVTLVSFGIFTNYVYLKTLRRFPYLRIDHPEFIASGILTFINHYLWFRYFNNYPQDKLLPNFAEISSFFGICVWLIPFLLFISLSAGENLLPSMNNNMNDSDGVSYNESYLRITRKSRGLIKLVINRIRAAVLGEPQDSII